MCLGALVHDTLISPPSISRATKRRARGGALRSSQTHTSHTQTLARNSPWLVLRITTSRAHLANRSFSKSVRFHRLACALPARQTVWGRPLLADGAGKLGRGSASQTQAFIEASIM